MDHAMRQAPDGAPSELVYFLGGQDPEMRAIRELLEEHAPGRFYDRGLSWGPRNHLASLSGVFDLDRLLVQVAEVVPGLTVDVTVAAETPAAIALVDPNPEQADVVRGVAGQLASFGVLVQYLLALPRLAKGRLPESSCSSKGGP